MNKILELNKVSFGYGNNLIFDDISFSVNEGEFVALVGDNGVGKTTLMKLIIGQLKPEKGQVKINFSETIGYVPQLSASISNNFPITVKEILSLNLKEKKGLLFSKNTEFENQIDTIINLVGLKGKKNSLFGNLSGGQKQKTMLGKALIANPKLLLLDEPLIGLDQQSKDSFLHLLIHQCKFHKITIIMITHELKDIEKDIDRVLEIGDGKVVEK